MQANHGAAVPTHSNRAQNPSLNPYAAPSAAGARGVVSSPAADDHAARGTRLAARFIDVFLLMGAIAVGGALVPFLGASAEEGHASAAVLRVFVPALALYVYQCYLVATEGQSLAKRWLNIRIERLDGEPVGFVHGVLLRSWVMQLLNFIPLMGLIDSVMIFSEEHRCLHDRIAGTIVVKA